MTTTTQKPKQSGNGCLTGCGVFFLLVIILSIIGNWIKIKEPPKTPEQEKQEQKESSDRWYNETSTFSCERSLREDLRKPSSYERSGDFLTTSDNGNEKVIIWKFRAENGFGGTNVAAAICNISKKNGGEYNVKQITE